MERYGILKCGAAQFDVLDRTEIIAYRKMDYEWQVLVSDRENMRKKYSKVMIVPATIDEIMLLCVKGGKRMKGVFASRISILRKAISLLRLSA